jgi:hypothetical protein
MIFLLYIYIYIYIYIYSLNYVINFKIYLDSKTINFFNVWMNVYCFQFEIFKFGNFIMNLTK